MKKSLYIGILFAFVFCKSEEKKKEAPIKKEVLQPQEVKEGWVRENLIQAYYVGKGVEEEEAIFQAKKRLSWLLLIDTYELSKGDEYLAEKVARSKSFQKLGEEKIFKVKEGDIIRILYQRTGENLREKWEDLLKKLENIEPRLKILRRE